MYIDHILTSLGSYHHHKNELFHHPLTIFKSQLLDLIAMFALKEIKKDKNSPKYM